MSPCEQGKGFGGKLVEAALSWCDEQPELDGMGVFTCAQRDVQLFSQHGFSVLERLSIGNIDGELLFYRAHGSD